MGWHVPKPILEEMSSFHRIVGVSRKIKRKKRRVRKKLFIRFVRCAENFLFLVAVDLCSPKEHMPSTSSWSNWGCWARTAAWPVYFCRDPDLQQMCVQKSAPFTPWHLYCLCAAQACYWPRERERLLKVWPSKLATRSQNCWPTNLIFYVIFGTFRCIIGLKKRD